MCTQPSAIVCLVLEQHVAILRHYSALEDVVRKGLKELPVELSKTSKPMEWNKPPKKHVSPLPVKGISFTKPSFGKGDATATVGCAKYMYTATAYVLGRNTLQKFHAPLTTL